MGSAQPSTPVQNLGRVSTCLSAHAGQLRALKALWQQLALRPDDLPAFLAACPDVGRLQV